MRKSAAEYIRSLEARIARLERGGRLSRTAKVPTVTLTLVSNDGDWNPTVRRNVKLSSITRVMRDMLNIYGDQTDHSISHSIDGAEWEVDQWESRFNYHSANIALEVYDYSGGGQRSATLIIGNADYYRTHGQHIPDRIIDQIEREFNISRSLNWKH